MKLPTYAYKCDKCGKEEDKKHSMSESPEILCECGAKMRKNLGCGIGVIFKEGTFYCKGNTKGMAK